MNPNKCPIADEGDDGTVQGLTHTNMKPNKDNNLLKVTFKKI